MGIGQFHKVASRKLKFSSDGFCSLWSKKNKVQLLRVREEAAGLEILRENVLK